MAEVAPNARDCPGQTTSPRRRKRKATSTGAVEDCFACQEVQAACDRRRPYCSQCIDNGKTCSGYKTALTWGVGVASRGKLRGLTLPVTKGKQADSRDKGPNGAMGRSVDFSPSARSTTAQQRSGLQLASSAPNADAAPVATPTTYDFVHVDPNAPPRTPTPPPPSLPKSAHPRLPKDVKTQNDKRRMGKRKLRRDSLQPISMPPAASIDQYVRMPMTAGISSSFGELSFDSAIGASPTSPELSHPYDPDTSPKPYPAYTSWPAMPIPGRLGDPALSTSWPSENMSSSLGSESSNRDFVESGSYLGEVAGLQNAPGSEVDVEAHSIGPSHRENSQPGKLADDQANQENSSVNAQVLEQSLWQFGSLTPNFFVGSTPALRELITYYDRVISPVIVAFDGPANPFRQHILPLASQSETLQHAIAALAASNLRMRRDYETVTSHKRPLLGEASPETTHDASVRNSSIAHNQMRENFGNIQSEQGPGRPSRQELYHKAESIRSLNAKLADPAVRDNDDVLATLLILCLYHICDTGVAKFRTQFAGVKRILALRNGKKDQRLDKQGHGLAKEDWQMEDEAQWNEEWHHQPEQQGQQTNGGGIATGKHGSAREIRWLVTMFCWFDAMTATVNDGEGQIDPYPYGVEDLDPDEWALENLAGCDARLFRTISKLGRLNLMSQGMPVVPKPPCPQPHPPWPRSHDYYSMPPGPAEKPIRQPDIIPNTPLGPNPADLSTRFWAEWSGIRRELADWTFLPATIPPSMRSSSAPSTTPQGPSPDTQDLLHISESFRFAALLYTERLAYPGTAAAAPRFQVLVDRALAHIRTVRSDVYLLWPLFITGAECVRPEHRALVRKRCLDIQADSGFFNNMSTLELLERIWRGEGERGWVSGGRKGKGSAFQWRDAMGEVDGEYIVI